MSVVLRSLATLASLGVAAFCAFGFLASFEPGIGPAWRVGYAIAFGLAMIGTVFPWRQGRRT